MQWYLLEEVTVYISYNHTYLPTADQYELHIIITKHATLQGELFN